MAQTDWFFRMISKAAKDQGMHYQEQEMDNWSCLKNQSTLPATPIAWSDPSQSGSTVPSRRPRSPTTLPATTPPEQAAGESTTVMAAAVAAPDQERRRRHLIKDGGGT
ncbi:unnamed protein product [Urochloa humidicola]